MRHTPPEDGARVHRPAGGGPAPSYTRRGILGRFFEPVRVPREAQKDLAELASRGSLVFVMRSAGLLNFLYLRWLLRSLRLPPLSAARNFTGVFGWLARVGRTLRAFEDAIFAGASALVFLGRRSPKDPFAALVRLQRRLYQPVLLVPVLLVWTRRAPKLKPSLLDALFGSPEAPNALANAVAFLRSYRRAFFVVGRPLDLKATMADRAQEPDAVLARKVRGVLHQRLAREFRAAVGPPLKAPSRVRDKVLRDRSLRATVEAVSRASGRPHAAVVAEAERDLREIASRYDPLFIQVMRPVLSWLFGRLYTSIEVDEEGLARVQRVATEAPIVLCPSHKSHVDYLVLSWLLYERGMTPPHVAAGINLAFWPFGSIARRGGAFFIRRKVKGDRIYTAVLRSYVKHLLRDRFPQEFYVEGGRSRTGKLLFPKTGLVSMEIDAWLERAADDVVFVPIAIDYEKLVEASSYVRELAGAEKRKESLRELFGAARVLFRRYERLYVQFGEPISLRAVAEQRLGEDAPSLSVDAAWRGEAERSTAMVPEGEASDDPVEAKRRLVQAVANRVAYGMSSAVTITSFGLAATALLSHVRRGIGAGDVARRVELLRHIATEGGARFAPELRGAPSDPRQEGPIAGALRRLQAGRIVRVETVANETIYQVDDEHRPVLDYHRNAVIHRFVAPAIVAAAVRGGGAETSIAAARARALWLSRLLKLEFMYRARPRSEDIFTENLELLARVGALSRNGEVLRPGSEPWALDFLAELLRSYLESYRLAAETALALASDSRSPVIDRQRLVREALEQGRAAFLSGRLVLRESLSKATIENAREWFVSQRVMIEESGGLRLSDADALRSTLDGIATFLPR